METLSGIAPALALVATVLAVAGLAISGALLARVRRFARPFEALAASAAQSNVADLLQAQLQGVERNAHRIEEVLTYTRRLRSQSMNALQGIGFLRYDAFDDIRGKQSFSLCLVDAHQNGVLITSIAGRMDSRTYAKPVKAGACDTAISDEEQQAIGLARQSLEEVHEPVVVGV